MSERQARVESGNHGAEVPKEYAGDEVGGKRRSRSNKSKQIITQILSGRELGDYKSKNE